MNKRVTNHEFPRQKSLSETKSFPFFFLFFLFFNINQERKELIKGQYRDKHFDAGSILLGFGVLEAVFGGVNTWLRTGKLFPGPHLFGGAGKAAAFFHPSWQRNIQKKKKQTEI